MTQEALLEGLRAVGWNVWDPLDMLRNRATWIGQPFADKYDGQLEEAARLVSETGGTEAAAAYLVAAERDVFGRGVREETLKRARSTADAVKHLLDRLDL